MPLVEATRLVVPLALITLAEAGTAQHKVRSQSTQYWLDSWGTATVDQLNTVAVAHQLNIVEVVQLNTVVVAAVVELHIVEAGHKVAEAVLSTAAQLLEVSCRVVVAEAVQRTVAEVGRSELEWCNVAEVVLLVKFGLR